MVLLSFALSPDAVARLHDILICLSRFNETVSIEARADALSLTALNSSKTTYASFALGGSRFFSEYNCTTDSGSVDVRFTCRILGKALLSVFKGKLNDHRSKDSAVERCEVLVKDGAEEVECRFIIKMFCCQGVVKTYRLTYESAEIMHALFDRNISPNRWTIQSGLLKEFIEYFGTRTEQLDIFAEDDRVVFTSYTEKITNGKEILKHPMRTAVSANKSDFDKFSAQDKKHIVISVRDFKSVVSHADTLRTSVSAHYSQPTKPLQFSYSADGMFCEFTLMTSGEHSNDPTSIEALPPPMTRSSSRAQPRTATTNSTTISTDGTTSRNNMPPPDIPNSRAARRTRPPGSAKAAAFAVTTAVVEQLDRDNDPDPESLFVPEQDDDRWDPVDFGHEEEETLGWDASGSNEPSLQATFRDSGTLTKSQTNNSIEEGLAPTQRLSEVHGLW